MSTHPVSVIIPIWVRRDQDIEWLHECLDSCLPQSDDVIVSVDGLCEPLRIKHDNLTILYGPHIGKSHARNVGVQHAKNALIYPVDADDWLAPECLDILMGRWRGRPVYSNIHKVHGTTSKPYVLLPFDCDLILTKCISSVNVLHSVSQWEAIGGWNESLNIYEDWEYNSKLFWMYCADMINDYLVHYRQHKWQSTASASTFVIRTAESAVRSNLEDFARRNTMGCCGKRRRSVVNRTPATYNVLVGQNLRTADMSVATDLSTLGDPGPGNVWAKYLSGRGMGPHSRRGMNSRKKYKRIKYGGVYAVKSVDAIDEAAYSAGRPNCGFVALQLPSPTPVKRSIPVAQPVVDNTKQVARAPVAATQRVPVVDDVLSETIEQLADMSIRDLKKYVRELNAHDITLLLKAEQSRDNPRSGAVKLMEKALNRLTSAKE